VELEVLDTLDRLRADGKRLGLVSNITLLPRLVREDLDRMGLGSRLDATVFSSEVGVRKPDPRIFREALGRLGSDSAETVFVGDRLYDDISGAQAVGMRAVLTKQFRREDDPDYEPDAVIEHITELPQALERLSRTG
jgi:HAD superfamily hydrolase (TIGR01509 family)